MTLKDRLNTLRERRAGSWTALARELEVSRAMIDYVRRGQRSFSAKAMMRLAALEAATGIKRHVTEVVVPGDESRDKLVAAISAAAAEIESASPSVRWMLAMAIEQWAGRLTGLLKKEARSTIPKLDFPPIASSDNPGVDNITPERYEPEVTDPDEIMPQLIESVRLLTNARGSRAALARTLGVRPQRLNEWLSGKRMPRGQISLLLREWVREEEAQQKSDPEGALTPPGQVTQLGKSSHEKPKSGQKKASHEGSKKAISKRGKR